MAGISSPLLGPLQEQRPDRVGWRAMRNPVENRGFILSSKRERNNENEQNQ
jgi:hypothetical protein